MNQLENVNLGTVITAMVTPFTNNLELDVEGAIELAKWLVNHGSDGLVLFGTTGEGPVLNDDEKEQLLKAVKEAVSVPIIANTGSNDTEHSIYLTELALDLGADGILAVTPYYNRPPQRGIENHFVKIAKSAGNKPVILYDIPVRTGRKISLEVLENLLNGVENIVGVKDAAQDIVGTSKLLSVSPDALIYSGDDAVTFALVCHGAVGVIGVATHWIAAEMKEMIELITSGRLADARNLHNLMLPSFMYESSELNPNPIPAKAVMRKLGLPSGQCRLPLGDGEEIDRLASILLDDLRTKGGKIFGR